MPAEPVDVKERLDRIEQKVDEYFAEQRRRLLQQLTKCRRLANAHKAGLALEEPPRVH